MFERDTLWSTIDHKKGTTTQKEMSCIKIPLIFRGYSLAFHGEYSSLIKRIISVLDFVKSLFKFWIWHPQTGETGEPGEGVLLPTIVVDEKFVNQTKIRTNKERIGKRRNWRFIRSWEFGADTFSLSFQRWNPPRDPWKFDGRSIPNCEKHDVYETSSKSAKLGFFIHDFSTTWRSCALKIS